jgi:hypothetical protein
MKLILFFYIILFSTTAFASNDPFEKETQACVKQEMINQFPYYSQYTISEFEALGDDNENFDYVINIENPQTKSLIFRSFIIVRNGNYISANLYFNESSRPLNINLSSCLELALYSPSH